MKYKIVLLNASVFMGLFLQDHEFHCITTKGLPKGTKFIAFQFANINGQVGMIVEHESFEPISVGQPFPEFKIEMKSLG